MPHNPQVTLLRHLGNLDEALILAKKGLNKNPGDLKNKIDLAWVLYDLIKKSLNERNVIEIRDNLTYFDTLKIPQNENMIHDKINLFRKYVNEEMFILLDAKRESIEGNHDRALELYRQASTIFPLDKEINEGLGWEIKKKIDNLVNDFRQSNLVIIRRLLKEFLDLKITKPSKLYSSVLFQIEKISSSYDKFPYFVKEWDLKNFMT